MGTMQRTSNDCSNVFDALTDLTNKYDDVVDFMSTIKRLHQWEAALLLMEEMRRNGFEFYDVPVLDGLFKQGVRVWSARASIASSHATPPKLDFELGRPTLEAAELLKIRILCPWWSGRARN